MKSKRELELEKEFICYKDKISILTGERWKRWKDGDTLHIAEFDNAIREAEDTICFIGKELYDIKIKRIKVYTRRKESKKFGKYKIEYMYSIENNTNDFTLEEVISELIPLCEGNDLGKMLSEKLDELIFEKVKNENM